MPSSLSFSATVYRRKLYALLRAPEISQWGQRVYQQLQCFRDHQQALEAWWPFETSEAQAQASGATIQAIAAASDRVNLRSRGDAADGSASANPEHWQGSAIPVRHPISGQQQTIHGWSEIPYPSIPETIQQERDPRKVFWWFWRFYPELLAKEQADARLFPAHCVLPDCPLHSHQATVSALTGARFPHNNSDKTEHPYLLLFTFSPVQEFIKASRKFLDFWAGSYLLHYLSARLCWHIAQTYGPDAVIVPSLWGQDIFDAFLLHPPQPFTETQSEADEDTPPFPDPAFSAWLAKRFKEIGDKKTPVERFSDRSSNSLSTAGFPNIITALVPGKAVAEKLGNQLAAVLRTEWYEIGQVVRRDIRTKVSQAVTGSTDSWKSFGKEVLAGLPLSQSQQDELTPAWTKFGQNVRQRLNNLTDALQREDPHKEPTNEDRHRIFAQVLDESIQAQSPLASELLLPYLHDLRKWILPSNWRWGKLWKAQLDRTWEPYWTAVPLGDPQQPLEIEKEGNAFDDAWIEAQSRLSQAWVEIPSEAEKHTFDRLNAGTWWGSFQQRLRLCIRAVKNTRVWRIPVAPGERSTISGQFSAMHPNLRYEVVPRNGMDMDFREGGGLPAGSMRLFWLLMAKAYPGLFSGSEHLNALELTKRMAWIYGDMAESLGIPVRKTVARIRSHKRLLDRVQIDRVERFLYDRFVRFPNLSSIAAARFIHNYPDLTCTYYANLEAAIAGQLGSRSRRIFQRIARMRPGHLPKTDRQINPGQRKRCYLNGVMFSSKWLAEDLGLEREQANQLRGLVENAHQACQFGEGSPSDWWAIVLADGDGMGQYISGSKLGKYKDYLIDDLVIRPEGYEQLLTEKKRMGPATHVGLNRALLDFSNRLVPYLTEKRFCGRAIYSGGDDVMAVLPLEDLPEYLLSLRAAWCGGKDPVGEFDSRGGYWHPISGKGLEAKGILPRPHFTMGEKATMSMGIVVAYKSVPLPTVLENLWVAEKDRAKEMPGKDGLCFRVIYGGGNTLEALMKGKLLDSWWEILQKPNDKLAPALYRLAEELPKRTEVSHLKLCARAANVILNRREAMESEQKTFERLETWIAAWEDWAWEEQEKTKEQTMAKQPLGTTSKDLGYLLRFSAFWVDKMVQRQQWGQTMTPERDPEPVAAVGR